MCTDLTVKSRALRQWHHLISHNRISGSSQQIIPLPIANPSLSLSRPFNPNRNHNHNRCKCKLSHNHQLPASHCKHHNRHGHRLCLHLFLRPGYGHRRWGYDLEDRRRQEGDRVSRGSGILTKGYGFLNLHSIYRILYTRYNFHYYSLLSTRTKPLSMHTHHNRSPLRRKFPGINIQILPTTQKL